MNQAVLDKLHGFAQPPPPSWMPQTIGWYVLFALLAVGAVLQITRWIRDWKRNWYRRAALRELPRTPAEELSALLKRTALAAWPREKVAALTGQSWLQFLNQTLKPPLFEGEPGCEIEELSVRNGSTLSPQEEREIRHLAEQWIRRHRVQA
jgi:Domain of unknown function (DUF4381)